MSITQNMSKIRILVIIPLMILSQGELIQSTTTSPDNGCYNGEVFLSYIDLNRYNTSNPYIDFDNVVVAMLDHITGRKLFTDYIHDLVSVWVNVCKAKDDPEKEVAAWKDLANEIHHRLHSDESLVFVVKKIFGDRLVPWIMSPPRAIFVGDSHVRNCIQRLSKIFVDHCGSWYSFGLKYAESFYAMCSLEVRDDEFTEAAKETCRDYDYTPHPLMT